MESINETPKRGLGTRILLIVGSTIAFIWAACILTLIFGVFVWHREARGGPNTLIRTSPEIRAAAVPVVRAVAPQPKIAIMIATPEGGDYESAVLKNIYTQVNDSVVNITVLSSGSVLNTLGDHQFNEDDLLPAGGGSGFVWDEYGHIVTNQHVVDGVSQLQVTFSDGAPRTARPSPCRSACRSPAMPRGT